MEEGATLSRTLLPHLNKVTDYAFLQPDSTFIMGRFLTSLITHVVDTQSTVESGFILFGIHINPRALRGIFCNSKNAIALGEALKTLSFP